MCVRKFVSNKECKCDQLRVFSKSVATFKVRREGQLADLWLTLQSSRLISLLRSSNHKLYGHTKFQWLNIASINFLSLKLSKIHL